ncbi:DNA-binding ATP-dependent protease La [Pseudodesulfovibrio profundus]|uniref:Lon protease n=1 Tax=Pseudodesulfovibrio profundus TaxID=57320 RepID=A0A2C8F6S4_9BACT|nr:endopeptidase La [Pseudodesulfovibrio profundus]SOB57829.1 DNA-binding ATP-dependent protease La [Pseudodesulfovibrio profundus]|tara:strand:+ start:2193 stop:4658 length:2466 start_codon:yes stop_codon:yes gene_type:complete
MPTFGFDGKKSPESMNLPMMSLREVVMFPRSIVPLFVGREASIKAIETAVADYGKQIFLVTQKSPEKEHPEADDLYEMGTVSKILQMLRLPDGTIKVLFEGVSRALWDPKESKLIYEDIAEDEYPQATVTMLPEEEVENPEAMALIRAVHESLDEFGKVNKKVAPEAILAMSTLKDAGQLADQVMPHLKIDFARKQEILEEMDAIKRLERVYELLLGEIEIVSIEKRVKGRVKDQMEKNQREYYLNEQVKAINKEMGREDDPLAEAQELEDQLDAKPMSEENRERVRKELKKLRSMQPSSAEYTVVRNYIDWVLDLPWDQVKNDGDVDIKQAREILDQDHFGLEKPKERILEYLAVQTLVESMKGPILCFVGPPGVGKTSIAKSIARSMDREFIRLSLGGVRDEAEIRGHRRTYVGAMPGKIIQSFKRVKNNNPVICLDEVDKMSADFRGDPSAALLEVLDPEQNYAFNDHYLDLDYDLSKVFFITTANQLEGIPLPLQDRMEIIRLPGYLETEKVEIAKGFLLPKQIEQHGLKPENIQLSDNALLDIVRYYTREAGVRNLEREVASICRKSAMKIVEEQDRDKTVHVTKQSLEKMLGVQKFTYGEREQEAQVGVCNGLAWTQLGGEMLLVEVALMPGKGKVEITGKLGDVMQESARAAISYIRSRSDLLGLKPDFNTKVDIHIHVPDGATPKDGPSAGITLTTALISALLNIPVRHDLAMTGEITLRGRVLAIGGLREKLLAAHRGLIKTVLIPADNEKNLKDVPKDILKELEVIPVKTMDEVVDKALENGGEAVLIPQHGEPPLANELLKEEQRKPARQ